jgi:hypothetical protein
MNSHFVRDWVGILVAAAFGGGVGHWLDNGLACCFAMRGANTVKILSTLAAK